MQFLHKNEFLQRVSYFHELKTAKEWESPPFEGMTYACLFVLGDKLHAPEFRSAIAREIVASNCRYCVYYGNDREAWDHAVMEATWNTPEYDTPDEILIIDDQYGLYNPLEEVLYSFYSLCNYEDIPIRHFLILFFDIHPLKQEGILTAIKKHITW